MLAIGLTALGLLVLNWFAYPLIMAVTAGRRRREPAGQMPGGLPSVAVIVATRESPETVLGRVNDIRRARYPSARLEVIVAVDARSPYAPDDHTRFLEDRAVVVSGDAPGGKAAALNAGVRRARADLLVFTDSHQRFATDAIAELVEFLADRRFGAVSGALLHEGNRLVDLYWKYEMLIRRGQAAVHSIAGGTGAIHAMRRELWQPLPAELISDDLYITMRLVLGGHRVGFAPAARAFDPRRFTDRQLFRRRVRTLTGVFQCIAWMPAALLPWRNPIWAHFVCHKLMRFVTPYLVIAAVLGVVGGLMDGLGTMFWLAIGAGAVLAATMAVLRPEAIRNAGVQAGSFGLLLAAPVVATVNGFRKRWQVWQP